MGDQRKQPGRSWTRIVIAALLQTLALALGAATLPIASFATALIADAPTVFIFVGLIATVIVMFLVTYLAVWCFGSVRRWRVSLTMSIVAAALLFAVFANLFLKPLIPENERFVRTIPDDVALWDLPTGSTVAVRSIAARGERRSTPIVFLHGGPGAYSVDLPPTVDVVSRLSADGYDVYFYDQVGGGLSARLDDISEYTLDRHLRDLEAFYERIDSEKMILIGSSGGASLGANYMAVHPTHVEAAVFSGPSPIYHPAWSATGDGGLDERLTPEQQVAFSAMVETPRLFAAIVLADFNPRAAVRFAGQAELGSLFDKVANEFYLPIAVCDMDGINVSSHGYGFWSNRMTSKSLRARTDDPRPALRRNDTPVLVLRGACEYKKEQVATEYVNTFPNAELTTFDNAGHMLLWEEPDAYLLIVRQFLAEALESDAQQSD